MIGLHFCDKINYAKIFKKRWYFILIVVLIVIFIFTKKYRFRGKNKVDNYVIKRENLKEVLTLSGEINASEKATLNFQTSGRLAWVGVKEGDYVKNIKVLRRLTSVRSKKLSKKSSLHFQKQGGILIRPKTTIRMC